MCWPDLQQSTSVLNLKYGVGFLEFNGSGVLILVLQMQPAISPVLETQLRARCAKRLLKYRAEDFFSKQRDNIEASISGCTNFLPVYTVDDVKILVIVSEPIKTFFLRSLC